MFVKKWAHDKEIIIQCEQRKDVSETEICIDVTEKLIISWEKNQKYKWPIYVPMRHILIKRVQSYFICIFKVTFTFSMLEGYNDLM